jgi:hypothetical protein
MEAFGGHFINRRQEDIPAFLLDGILKITIEKGKGNMK